MALLPSSTVYALDAWTEDMFSRAETLLAAVERAATAVSGGDDPALARECGLIEAAWADLTTYYRGTVGPAVTTAAGGPAGVAGRRRRAHLAQLVRLMAALDGLLVAAARHIGLRSAVASLRATPLTPADLPPLGATAVARLPAAATAYRRFFHEQSLEVLGVIWRCTVFCPAATPYVAGVVTSLRTVNAAGFGLTLDDAVTAADPLLQLTCDPALLLTEAEMADELLDGTTAAVRQQVRAWAESLDVLSVTDWDGTVKYPRFQLKPWASGIGLVRVDLTVVHMLAHLRKRQHIPGAVQHPLYDWPLAIYLQSNLAQGIAWFDADLADKGLRWPPGPATSDHRDRIEQLLREDMVEFRPLAAGRLFRVDNSEFVWPYYYSTTKGDFSGRYDPAFAPGKGTWYVGETALGCWAETLHRHPVVTLGQLSARRQTEFAYRPPPGGGPALLDLTAHAKLPSAPRPESQAIAALALTYGARGIRYTEAQVGGEIGLALFGDWPDGAAYPTDPSDTRSWPDNCGLAGTWTIVGTASWHDCDGLWDYLVNNRGPRNPLILRRLPSDAQWTAAAP
jgi:hypothetical protein